jgi:hypothetical protein
MSSSPNFSSEASRQLSRALVISAEVFKKVVDKNGAPYQLHCIEVMQGVKERGYDVMAAAVLHDVVEDTPITLSNLSTQFSARVVFLVDLLTKKPKGTQTYDEYIDRLSVDRDAICIKLADLRHNSLISRLPGFEPEEGEKLLKYARAYQKLTARLEGREVVPVKANSATADEIIEDDFSDIEVPPNDEQLVKELLVFLHAGVPCARLKHPVERYRMAICAMVQKIQATADVLSDKKLSQLAAAISTISIRRVSSCAPLPAYMISGEGDYAVLGPLYMERIYGKKV